LGWDEGAIRGGIWTRPAGSTNQYRALERPFQAAVGRWIQLIQIWNGQTLTQWVDGRPIESISAAGVLASGDSPIRIGWDQYYFFKGDIDEVRVYDRALTDDEARALYRQGLRRAFRTWWASGAPL
jgi:hypothetical protein